MSAEEPLERLDAAERLRLERFLARVEHTSVELLLTLAATPLDADAHAEALGHAGDAARDALRRPAVDWARTHAREWVIRLYNRSTNQPGWWEANWGRPGTTGDRAHLAASLAEALTALVLWDRLDETDRDELLGAFAALVA
jgi:hypothetical protein